MSKIIAAVIVGVVAVGGTGIDWELIGGQEPSVQTTKCVVEVLNGHLSFIRPKNSDTGTLSSYFDKNTSDKSKNKACLVVGWAKSAYSESKWRGGLAVNWVFANDNKAMIMFNTISFPSSEEGTKFEVSGLAFLLEKENNTWQYKKKKEASHKVSSKDDLDKYFPKPKNDLTELGESNKNYWGFISGKEEVEKTCRREKGECTGNPTKSSFIGVWSWTGSSTSTEDNKKLEKWAESLDWVDQIYSNWGLKSSLEGFTGDGWTKKQTTSSNPE